MSKTLKHQQKNGLGHITNCATESQLCAGAHNWEKSVGVQAEIAAARAMGKPVTFLDVVNAADENRQRRDG